jgi:large subunit ribosomal protein L28
VCLAGRLERNLRSQGSESREKRRKWSEVMSQVCNICGKGPQFGNNISHAHNVTRRRWNINLQAVRALINGSAKKIRVCTSCIKSGKIEKA